MQTLWYSRFICTLCKSDTSPRDHPVPAYGHPESQLLRLEKKRSTLSTLWFGDICKQQDDSCTDLKSLLEPIDFGAIYISSILPNHRWKSQRSFSRKSQDFVSCRVTCSRGFLSRLDFKSIWHIAYMDFFGAPDTTL
jgi:hypothetical protein